MRVESLGVGVRLPPDGEARIPVGIRVSPFHPGALDATMQADPVLAARALDRLRERAGRDVTLTASGRHALALVLDDLSLGPDDVVTIMPTFGTPYVSRCVTSTIETRCRWSMRVEPATRAALVIHEWGVPHGDVASARALGVPVIEDCAYAFASSVDGQPVGRQGDYAIFSFPKLFSVNFGGMVTGLRGDGAPVLDHMRSCSLLAGLAAELERVDDVVSRRRGVWRGLADEFLRLGARPYFSLTEGVEPGVFLFAVDPATCDPADVRAAYEAHGVEASVYYGSDACFVPCHQRLGPGAIAYLAAVFESVCAPTRRGSP